jgi:NitT/TauT family transport system ATP-binding protein
MMTGQMGWRLEMQNVKKVKQTIDTIKKTIIDIKDVSKVFYDKKGEAIPVINNLNLELKEKEFLSIVGPSGCGKSTLFNIIAGLLSPTTGEVVVNGKNVGRPTGHVGYMMQRDMLLPWRTIIDNIVIGLEIRNITKKDRYCLAMEYLKKYGLDSFANSYPNTLSGGMRQRVALIRTLVINPDIILLDEPFSALDYQTRLVLEEEILDILREFGKTVVLITHDIGEAIAMSDRIAVLSKRPTFVKKIYDVGLSEELGSGMKVRADKRYSEYFEHIWNDLDIQIGGAANGNG